MNAYRVKKYKSEHTEQVRAAAEPGLVRGQRGQRRKRHSDADGFSAADRCTQQRDGERDDEDRDRDE